MLKIIEKFKSVLKSEKFKDDLLFYRKLISDLHTFDILKGDFVWFLVAYPLSDKKKKIMSKLTGKQKFGMLSRHLASVSSKLGISQLYLKQYYELKEREKEIFNNIKSESWKYHYNFFDDNHIKLRSSDTEEKRALISNSEHEIRGRWHELSNCLLKQTMDLIDFCLKQYDSREDKINQILGDL